MERQAARKSDAGMRYDVVIVGAGFSASLASARLCWMRQVM